MAGETHCRWRMTEPDKSMSKTAFDPPLLEPDEALARIAGRGACHADLGFSYDGVRTNRTPPLTLGHEISGRVVSAQDQASGWIGKAAIVVASVPCGDCGPCRRGKATICRKQIFLGSGVDGGFVSRDRYRTIKARHDCASLRRSRLSNLMAFRGCALGNLEDFVEKHPLEKINDVVKASMIAASPRAQSSFHRSKQMNPQTAAIVEATRLHEFNDHNLVPEHVAPGITIQKKPVRMPNGNTAEGLYN